MRPILVLSLLLLLAAPARAQLRSEAGGLAALAAQDSVSLPRVTPLQFMGQVAAGVGGGVVGALVVSGVFYSLMEHDSDGWEGLLAVAAGTAVGYPIGAVGTVYLVSRGELQRGSLLYTSAGGAAGLLVGGLLAAPTGGLSYLLLVPTGAALGYNRSRRPR